MKLIKYTPEYRKYFDQLNRAWVEKYFQMEPMDEALLVDPETTIIKPGGQILFVEHLGQVIGTVALKYVSEGVFELSKMAVDEVFQGIGAGKFLCLSAIEEARSMNADKLILYTNSSLKTAIAIYGKFGFLRVPLIGQEYSRADTMMELKLNGNDEVKWFDRKFEFNLGLVDFTGLVDRLERTVTEAGMIISELPDSILVIKPGGKWSIKEQIGHLWILEPLWQKRFLEIKEGQSGMSPTDLSNSATDRSFFNQQDKSRIFEGFKKERLKTVQLLKSFSKEDLESRLVHPRLNQAMSVLDLIYFVAEHDAHHLSSIKKIHN